MHRVGKILVICATYLVVASCQSIPRPSISWTSLCSDDDNIEKLVEHQLQNGFTPGQAAKWFDPAEQPQAVVVAFHGLNNHPGIMDTLSQALAGRNFRVLRSGLKGHSGTIDHFKSVTRADWLTDVRLSYCAAKEQSRIYQIPIYALGFSLGGLVLTDFMSVIPPAESGFQRMVLLAPAITLRWYASLLRLGRYFPNLEFTSFTPKDYRAHDATTGAAYAALFAGGDSLQKAEGNTLHVPTLVIMDPRDRTVSIDGIRDFVEEKHLRTWHIEETSTDGGAVRGTAHHLIVDSQVLSQLEWLRVVEMIVGHFRQP